MLILRIIIKTVATSCQILRLKCIKFDFGWGCAPDPAGSLQRCPRPPSCDALLIKGKGEGKGREEEGKEREGQEERGGKRKWWEGRGGKGKECIPPPLQSYFDHCTYLN